MPGRTNNRPTAFTPLLLCAFTACMLSFDVPAPPPVECVVPSDCGEVTSCSSFTCNDGTCQPSTADDGTLCGENTDCLTSTCEAGECAASLAPAGTKCNDDGGDESDEAGECLGSLGTACGHDGQCLSGMCVDGFCCNSACERTCTSCGVPGAEGTCAPVAHNEDPDGDCDGAWACNGSGSCIGDTLCIATFGGDQIVSGDEPHAYLFDLALRPNGNVVAVGSFTGVVTFDDGQTFSESAGHEDVFAVELTPDCGVEWVRTFGGTGADSARAVAVDEHDLGNVDYTVYVVGLVDSDLTNTCSGPFCAKNFHGTEDGFLWRLHTTPDGVTEAPSALLFGGDLSGGGNEGLYDVAVGSDGSVVVAGKYRGLPYLQDTNPLQGAPGGGDTLAQPHAAVIKLTPGLMLEWIRTFGAGGNCEATGLAVDDTGIVVAGDFRGPNPMTTAASVPGTWLPTLQSKSEGVVDAFVVKLEPGGTVQWGLTYGDNEFNDLAWRVNALPGGRFGIAGRFTGQVLTEHAALQLTSANYIQGSYSHDGYVLTVDGLSGAPTMSLRFGGVGTDFIQDVVGVGDQILAVGVYAKEVTTLCQASSGPKGSVSAIGNGLTIMQFDQSGNCLWIKGYGGETAFFPANMATATKASAHEAIIGGQFVGTNVDFGLGTNTNQLGFDAIIMRIAR